MKRKVVVNDRMQKGYVYYRTEPVGRHFAPGFEPQLTPKRMLELGVFGGQYMTDCREEFPASWFARARLCAGRHDPRLNYFGVNASQSLAEWRRKGLDSPAGSARMVSVVLPVSHGPEVARRCEADSAVASHRAARRGHPEALRERRPRLPAPAAAGGAALGV